MVVLIIEMPMVWYRLPSFLIPPAHIYEDYDDSVWMVEEPLWKGITVELKELHDLKGASFIKKLKQIVYFGECPDFNRVFRKRYEK